MPLKALFLVHTCCGSSVIQLLLATDSVNRININIAEVNGHLGERTIPVYDEHGNLACPVTCLSEI